MGIECLEPHCFFSNFCNVEENKKSTNIQMLPKCQLSHYQTKAFRPYSPIPTDSKYVILIGGNAFLIHHLFETW